jgi:hypothetical protein
MVWRLVWTLTFLLSITHIKTQHKEFLPHDFQIVWACNLLVFFSFYFFTFWIFVLFCLKTRVYFTFFHHYIIHEHFTCFFTYNIFIFKKLGHFQFLQENATLRWRKKNQTYYHKPKHQNVPYNLKCKHLKKYLQNFP